MENTILTKDLKTIKLHVKFYDKKDEQGFKNFPTYNRLSEMAKNGHSISYQSFLTYYLFYKKNKLNAGYSSYGELSRKIGLSIEDLDFAVRFENDSIFSKREALPIPIGTIERIGEAVALSLISDVHRMHEADWSKIPAYRGRNAIRTFDYEQASDGTHIIQVEAKGTGTTDNLERSLNSHRGNIVDKKISIANCQDYPHPANLRYGVITSIHPENELTSWLVDPPGDIPLNSKKVKLLARLNFISNWISLLIPRSALAACLRTRIESLKSLEDPFLLNEVPLIRASGEPFPYFLELPNTLSHVMHENVAGTIVKTSKNNFFFVGIDFQLANLAIRQKFDSLLEYSSDQNSKNRVIKCKIPTKRARQMFSESFGPSRSQSYISFFASGLLHYSKSMLVFGAVTPRRG